ncbi:MAG TPA: class I SAM-dependent methyltransferase [Actinomycetes bacterium]|nr:class I SAM-dependent methyltransferase [Actinomycetes bacterium]
MDRTEIARLTALEDTHWWYQERRSIVRSAVRRLTPGVALDIGAAGGGNTRVLRDAGWTAFAVEYSDQGAGIARARGVLAMQGDARLLPVRDRSVDLIIAFDVLEHIEEDDRAVEELYRVLKPGGRLLVAVPADQRLWSDHDVAVGHVRRYDRVDLQRLLSMAGFQLLSLRSWNVLLRPAVKFHRARSSGSDLEAVQPLINRGLRAVVATERFLPVGGWPGVSLLARARRPSLSLPLQEGPR